MNSILDHQADFEPRPTAATRDDAPCAGDGLPLHALPLPTVQPLWLDRALFGALVLIPGLLILCIALAQ